MVTWISSFGVQRREPTLPQQPGRHIHPHQPGSLVSDSGNSVAVALGWTTTTTASWTSSSANGLLRSDKQLPLPQQRQQQSLAQVQLVGTTSNRSAIGAQGAGAGHDSGQDCLADARDRRPAARANDNDLRAHFGLGNATNVTTLRIEWPSGTVQESTNVAADQILTIIEPRRPVLAVAVTPTQVTGTLTGDTNQVYELQVSNDLDAGWTALTTVTTDASGKGNWTDLPSLRRAAGSIRP